MGHYVGIPERYPEGACGTSWKDCMSRLAQVPRPTVLHKSLPLTIAVLISTVTPWAFAQVASSESIANKLRMVRSTTAIPLSFERNQGQADAHVKFLSHGAGYSFLAMDREAVLELVKRAPDRASIHEFGQRQPDAQDDVTADAIQLKAVGASAQMTVTGLDPLPGTVNYFLGNDPAKWRSRIPTFSKVSYANVYHGVNLVYYGNQNQLEFDFEVVAGADPKPIHLQFAGAERLEVDRDGNLTIHAGHGAISFRKPVIYQTVAGTRLAVQSSFHLAHHNVVSFRVGTYDHTRPLVIDPILSYSTYVGDGSVNGLALDAAGNAYVAGSVSAGGSLATTAGAFQQTPPARSDPYLSNSLAYVAKINPTGTAYVYATYLGGSARDRAFGIALDANGNAYVAGTTQSIDFPTTPGAFQTTNHATTSSLAQNNTVFITKLNSTGTGLVYSTYLGGSTEDQAAGIAVDSAGNAYVTGLAGSSDFPVTSGAFQTVKKTVNNVAYLCPTSFVTKLNSTGTALVYSTYLGGSQQEQPAAITLDPAGSAYVTGSTESIDFPTTPGAFQTANKDQGLIGPGWTGYVAKLNPAGTGLSYSTYLGGSILDDLPYGIFVDASGDAYVTGAANSSDFPTTPGVFPPVHANGDGYNAYITKFNSIGTALVYSTFLGGTYDGLGGVAFDQGMAIAVDPADNATVVGYAGSIDFPLTPGAFQTENTDLYFSGHFANFVARINSTATSLLYSTFLGGTGDGGNGFVECGECVTSVALDSSGNVYLAGGSDSTDYPITAGAVQGSIQAAYSVEPTGGFVTKFNSSEMRSLPLTTTSLSSSAPIQSFGNPVTFTALVQPVSAGATPTGSVAFSLAFGPWQTVPLDQTGTAAYTTTTLSGGESYIAANYLGDTSYAPSNTSLTETITGTGARLPVVVTVTPSATTVLYGTLVTFSISVQDPSGKEIPGGTAILCVDAMSCETTGPVVNLDANGHATVTTSALPEGALQLSVNFYSNSSNYSNGSSASINETVTPFGTIPAPVFSVPSGTYTSVQSVTLSDASSTASIYYTIPNSPIAELYSGPFTISTSQTVQAYAVQTGYAPSATVSVTYTIDLYGPTPTPTFNPPGGNYTSAETVIISDAVVRATIYYTTDGSTPTTSSTVYSNSFTVSAAETVQAIALASDYGSSSVGSASYTFIPDFSVTASPASLAVDSGQSANATISVKSVNGFDSAVSFSCSGLPAGTSCSFSPATVIPPGTAASTTLTLTASTSASTQPPTPIGSIPVAALAFTFCFVRFRNRRCCSVWILCVAATLGLFCLSACGGGNSTPNSKTTPPPSESGTVTVMATSGSLSHSTSLTVYVN